MFLGEQYSYGAVGPILQEIYCYTVLLTSVVIEHKWRASLRTNETLQTKESLSVLFGEGGRNSLERPVLALG